MKLSSRLFSDPEAQSAYYREHVMKLERKKDGLYKWEKKAEKRQEKREKEYRKAAKKAAKGK